MYAALRVRSCRVEHLDGQARTVRGAWRWSRTLGGAGAEQLQCEIDRYVRRLRLRPAELCDPRP